MFPIRGRLRALAPLLAALSGACLLLVILGPGGQVQTAHGATTCPPVRVMPLGDSITVGEGEISDPGLMVGYRQTLYLSLTLQSNVDFVGSGRNGQAAVPTFDADHEGHSGWTTAQVSDTVYSFLQASPADVILLHVGTNDIGQEGFSVQQSTARVARILDEIDRFDRGITVVLARIINKKTPTQRVSDFNESVAAMAQDRIDNGDRIVVVDQENALDYPSDMADSVHPRQAGYEKMAAVWFEALQTILPPCGPTPSATPGATRSPVPTATASPPPAPTPSATPPAPTPTARASPPATATSAARTPTRTPTARPPMRRSYLSLILSGHRR